MKKFLLTASAVITATVTALLGGCSCAASTPLSFTNAFNGGGANSSNNLSTTYSETLTYDVSYDGNYNTYIKKDDSVSASLIPTYSGTYVSEFKGDISALPSNVSSDINYDGNIHYLKTTLNLTVTVPGETEAFHDQQIREVYFYSSGHSFAPIYSHVRAKNTYVTIKSSDAEQSVTAEQKIFEYITEYNLDSYTQTKRYYDGSDSASVNLDELSNIANMKNIEDPKTFSYTIKTAIDNVQLLFAIRNLNVASESSVTLPTIAPTYGKSKSLTVKNNDETTRDVNVTYNGEDKSAKISVKNLSFVIGGTDNAGSQQFLVIQKSEADGIPYRALPVEYAETLYSGMTLIGSLKYTLKSVTVTE